MNRVLLPKLENKLVCPTIYGFNLVLFPGLGSVINELYYLGFYEPGTLNIINKCLKNGDVFIDVGASVGLMSMYASGCVGANGRVFSFEPIKKNFECLTESISMNNKININAYNLGLGSKPDELPIYLDRPCPSMLKSADKKKDEKLEIIKIEKLDAILQKENVHEVKMIKIDVEGYEPETLKGSEILLSRPNAPVIIMEYDNVLIARSGMENPVTLLKKYNAYRFFQLEKGSDTISLLKEINQIEELYGYDNVFCFTDYHLENIPKDLFVN